MHRFRPDFLATSNGLPSYYEPNKFQHKCFITVEHNDDSDPLATNDDINPIYETKKCTSLPFVGANSLNKNEVAFRLASSIKEVVKVLLQVSFSYCFYSFFSVMSSR